MEFCSISALHHSPCFCCLNLTWRTCSQREIEIDQSQQRGLRSQWNFAVGLLDRVVHTSVHYSFFLQPLQIKLILSFQPAALVCDVWEMKRELRTIVWKEAGSLTESDNSFTFVLSIWAITHGNVCYNIIEVKCIFKINSCSGAISNCAR